MKDDTEQKHATREQVHLLVSALDLTERRCRQFGETENDHFERLAQEFCGRYGYYPPGKDDPIRCVSHEQAQSAWIRFLDEPRGLRRSVLAIFQDSNDRHETRRES